LNLCLSVIKAPDFKPTFSKL